MTIEYIPVDQIEAQKDTQVRVRLDPATIDDYAAAMSNNQLLPPVVAYREDGSKRVVLADGYHRLAAVRKVKLMEIEVDVREGTPTDALTHALGANTKHGLPRNNRDKRHAVEMCLDSPAYDNLSLREKADLCCVTHTFVANIMQERNEATEQQKKPKPNKKEEQQQTLPLRRTANASQGEVDKRELMEAVNTFRSFPYDGTQAVKEMGLGEEEVEVLTYVADWLLEVMCVLDPENYE